MPEILDKEDLRKSLLDFFTEDEADEMLEKAEKEGKFEVKDDESGDKTPEDEETVDQKAVKEGVKDDEVKKAYDKIMSAKADLDKSMTDFLDKFGSMPGVKTPDSDFTEKSEEDTLEKSEVNDFEKAFGSKFDSIEKGFETQNKVNEKILKSIQGLSHTVNQIAETPNPFKALTKSYGFIEKGEKTNEGGQKVVNLNNKEVVISEIEKSLDKIENEQDNQLVRNMLSDYSISNKLNPTGLNIVKKALNIDFEK
jgi:hypothetical protein